MNPMTVAFNGDVEAPQYKSEFAAGSDLRSNCDMAIPPHSWTTVPTGLFLAIPAGCEGQIRPRSGIALKHGVTVLNAPGTIDSDYRGEVKVILINHSNEIFVIEKGDRIAQLVIAPVMHAQFANVKELPTSERDQGGFGSTGKK